MLIESYLELPMIPTWPSFERTVDPDLAQDFDRCGLYSEDLSASLASPDWDRK